MATFQLWQKPHDANREIGHENRKVSWLELFFDIFFVCAIAAVGHILVKDMTMHGVKEFVVTFIPVWWVWIGFTFYNERFETFGIENRLFTFLMMIPAAGLAIFAHHATDENFPRFAISYALARVILGFLYGRAGFYIKDFKTTGYIYAVCFSLSVITIVLAVLFAPHPLRIYIFSAALIFDIFVPFIAAFYDGTFRDPESLNLSEKINERFGLFCIIVIGELIVAVVNGISELEHPDIGNLLVGVEGLAVGFGMWWVYFDFVARRGADKNAVKIYIWAYLHMPLVMTFVALSAGILYSIEHNGHLPDNARILIGISAGVTLILIGVIEFVSHRHQHEPMGRFMSSALKLITGAALILLGNFIQLETIPLLLIILSMLFVNMIYGVWIWVNQHEEYETEYTG